MTTFRLFHDDAEVLLHPTVPSHVRRHTALAPCVALVGCDGAGKSTLAADLTARLTRHGEVQLVYLGLGTGDLGRRIGRLPLIGRVAERFLTAKADKAHDGATKRLPGLATALVMFGFSLLRQRRFGRMMRLRARGVLIVADRYPQAEVAGSFDGPALSWSRPGSDLVERLAARERRLYQRMAEHRPTVVIRLNVDPDTALMRKADHKRSLLARKVAVLSTLRFAGAPVVDVDATRSYADVLDAVVGVLRNHGLRG